MNLLNQKGYVAKEVFDLLVKKNSEMSLIADLIRFNTLLSVARGGTGHLGASLSMIEVLTEIYFNSFDFSPSKANSKNRNVFILSKGHAAPSLYAILAAKGYFETDLLDKLRRIGGLSGHCDISTSGIEANTGSLAMGFSKAVGFALAKKRFKLKGNVIVIVGDGELQEGQCWEALLSASSFKLDNLYIIIDDNKVQTDHLTEKIVQYSDLISAFKNLGFEVKETDGSKIENIRKAFSDLKAKKAKPKILYSNSIKGQGISYMEHTNVLKKSTDRYIWHNKPPNKEQLNLAFQEIFSRIQKPLKKLGFSWSFESSLKDIPKEPMQIGIHGESLIDAFSKALLNQAKKNNKIVVFDGDLEEDCGFIPFHERFPERFFEMGIMEQNIVSVASAFSRMGFIPVVSTYAAFLTSRANEQIYNLASEGARAIIVGNMSGIIPATPGKSHQAFRDISCMKNIPGITMYQPISGEDTNNILARYFAGELGSILYLRLSMASSPENLPAPAENLKRGTTQLIKSGKDAILIGIGPVVLGEALQAAKILSDRKISLEIRSHPWIVEFDKKDYEKLAKPNLPLVIIEDHYHKGGFGESLLSFLKLQNITFQKVTHIALNDFPMTGFRQEILEKLQLDHSAIVKQVTNILK